jgi:hypothetical protein
MAVFVTPHGYGHAARECSIMLALRKSVQTIEFDIYTQVQEWVFADSLGSGFFYHSLKTDIGLAQDGPFTENIPDTIKQLRAFYPPDPGLVRSLADELIAQGDLCVLCDIAPLGITVAKQACVSSFLIQNFTWDWIYQAYLAIEPGLAEFIPVLKNLFASADFVLRTEPACGPDSTADIVTAPVSRSPRLDRAEIRNKLGIQQDRQVVLVTLGGMAGQLPDPAQLNKLPDVEWILPGASQRVEQRGNCYLLPHHSDFYHPDLVNACDAVVGKIGYSTLAEVYQAGIPFGFIPRENFPESPVLADYIRQRMTGMRIDPARFADGSWVELVPALVTLPASHDPNPTNGADQAADFILGRIILNIKAGYSSL